MSDPLLILSAILLTVLSALAGYQMHIFVVKRQIWWVTQRRGRTFNQLSPDQISALLLYAVGRRVEFPADPAARR